MFCHQCEAIELKLGRNVPLGQVISAAYFQFDQIHQKQKNMKCTP
jgi:hypothetical protein